MKNFFPVLLLLILFSNCNGQNQIVTENKISSTINSGLLKISKPEDGWQDASIGCSIEDKNGNLWFGSNGQGIYRYDGKTFTHFTEKDGLIDNIVYSILEDKTGNIWIGTKTGLSKYDGKAFTHVPIIITVNLFYNSKRTQNKNPLYKNGVWCMMQDKEGIIWLGTDDGVYCYNGNGFEHFIDKPNISNTDSLNMKAIVSLIQDSKGNIWFASNLGEGLIRFDGKTLSRITQKNYPWTASIEEDKNGNILFSSLGKGICKYDGQTITTNIFKEKDTNDLLYYIWKDKTGNIWFCDGYKNKPILYYNGNEIINFTDKNKLTDSQLAPVVVDIDGRIWFASSSMGLYRFDSKREAGNFFTKFSE